MHPSNDLNEFLNFLSFQVGCEIEINNIDFDAFQELTHKNPINLN